MSHNVMKFWREKMKNKFLRKILVYAISILVVAGVVGGIMAFKEAKEQAELEATYVDPLPVMSQEEMETLYDEHKADTETEQEVNEEVADSTNDVAVDVTGDNEEVASENKDAESTENTEAVNNVSVYEGCPVDFAGMWKVNKDVYAWITVPGTVIDYPILQHATDNTYYLNYNIDGSYGYPGCIYTENLNSKSFQDNNTVIYGHNMKNGTMFAGLHKFEDASFFEKNNSVIIYTPEKQLNYTIFAAYVYDDRHLLYSFNFADKAVYSNYIDGIVNMRSMNANIRKDVSVTGDSKIITLVTCMANQPEKRLLVQAVLQEG